VLRTREVRKSFGGAPALRGVDVEVAPGEIVCVLGANGSGKSTLLRCVVRLLEPDSGAIELCGVDLAGIHGPALRAARRRAAMIFQQVLLVRRRSALANVAFGALGELPLHRSASERLFPPEVIERAHDALHRVGLPHVAHQRADQLSGGQAQRVAIARALCQRADVVLADEPVASLDPRAAESVLGLLQDVAHRDGLGVLVVLHQPELARRYSDRIVGLLDGAVEFDRPAREVLMADIAPLYRHEDDGD
jgi:phosphonate transport system ATP-binding protein